MHEKRMHREASFVTLTYSNDHLPSDGSLVPSHLQSFHKRLHNRLLDARGVGIRYFACGEYGDLNKRPHYHSLLFGHEFHDKKIYSKNKRGECIYTSKTLDKIWGLGECKIGDVTFESACYVARYSLKKVSKYDREQGHYVVYDYDGVVHERVPEFAHMSRRPGIGSTYFDKYGAEIMQHDTVIMGNREVPSIRYYDKKIEAIDPARYKVIKANRQAKANFEESSPYSDKSTGRKRVKARILALNAKSKERKL